VGSTADIVFLTERDVTAERTLFGAAFSDCSFLCGGNGQIHYPKRASAESSIGTFKLTHTIPVIELELLILNSL